MKQYTKEEVKSTGMIANSKKELGKRTCNGGSYLVADTKIKICK